MILPLILIGLAIVCAGAVAYGTDPSWAQFHHGVDLIMISRRLEWPLVVAAIFVCITLIALVVAGRRRAWFLIGLAPVLALFAHRFWSQAAGREVDDNPIFVAAQDARFLADDDYVVGLSLKDADFAYPYALLFYRPVIIQTDRERRVLLLWSAYANRAVAFSLGRQTKGRDLEVVSTPANALLVYNSRAGEFINGVTALTAKGEKPSDVTRWLATSKMTWRQWREGHPSTQVLLPRGGLKTSGPTGPILPAFPLPPMNLDRPADSRVALVSGSGTLAIDPMTVKRAPLNLRIGDEPVLLFRPSPDAPLRAFKREVSNDLRPRFTLSAGGRSSNAVFVDSDTGSKWSAEGEWVEGPKEFKGKRLQPINVDDDLYWGVIKFWYPDLELSHGDPGGGG